jgi:DNA-binding NtrC family response regulator
LRGAVSFNETQPDQGEIVNLPTYTQATEQLLLDRLAHFNGDKTAAAHSLRISRKTLYNWLNRIEARKTFNPETTGEDCNCGAGGFP